MFLAQREDRLGRAQLVLRRALQQAGDNRAGGRADVFGRLAAPRGGAPVEGDLLRRVVLEVGHPPAVGAHVCLDQVAVVVDLHQLLGGAHVDLLARQ